MLMHTPFTSPQTHLLGYVQHPLPTNAALVENAPQVGDHLSLLADDLIAYGHLELELLEADLRGRMMGY